jgi:hypothetical protein
MMDIGGVAAPWRVYRSVTVSANRRKEVPDDHRNSSPVAAA